MLSPRTAEPWPFVYFLPGYEPLRARMGGTRPVARPLHRRRCPAPSGHLPHPFPPPSSLRKPPRRTLWGGRRFIFLVDVQDPLSRHGRRDRDKSASFFRAAAEHTLQPSSLFLFLLLRFYTGYARGPASSVSSNRRTPPTLPAWRPGPFDRKTPLSSHAYAPSPSPFLPSVGVSPSASTYPSFSPFSQTTTRKKGVSPGLALPWARHTADVRPTARAKGGDPLAGVQSVRHTLFLFPPPSTKSPIIPSLRHRHPTIASAVLQQPWGEAARHQPLEMGGALVGSVL